MTNEEIKKREIESALAAMNGGDFLQTSKKLLEVLNYHGPLIEELPETVEDFIQEYPAEKTDTKTEQEFRKNAKSIELVSQVGSDEIVDSQPDRFESRTFDKGLIKSFVFCTVELKDKDYSRSKYAEFTREINKRTTLATVVFFRVKNRLTIGFVGRRPSQLDESKDVLEKATLIKDIRLDNPHRAHLDILFELSLKECAKWMTAEEQPKNFDGLLEAWLARLGTEELNKKFYQELFAWFKWAVKEATFPTDKNRSLDPEEHVIRLITRLLFVWFIKEKGLVAEELFNETQVSPLLKNYDRDTGDSYYRVVLQNLFFATLNTEIEKREFSQGGNSVHRNFSLYRYEDQMLDPDKLLRLFAQTPFINGGLFDCLDSFKATGDGGYRIDCFSDKHYTKLSIPDRLFFDDRGLIPLLEHYKFTVEENTPIEQDVALDPELLGKVFENLLAEYNPQAGVTAQKQTGSYYTRRIIVDYMVDEALVAVLSQKCNVTKDWLRSLLDYAQTSDNGKKWSDNPEADCIVEAISQLKIIDPAVGSGAFPMGILHKLTLALRRLDPNNNRWEQLQQDRAGKRAEAAFKISNQQERDVELAEISDTFERYRDSDFGRKLYLIQNGIFGVDIQPVACQIAKLRFFISLAIEQEPTQEADNNFGIKPLPNLETRFVTANTLIGLQLSEARSLLQDDAVQQLLKEIEVIREKHVLANNRGQKLRLEAQEEDLHKRLEEELEIQRRKWVESQQREIEQKAARLPKPEHRKKWREEEQKKYRWRKKKFDSDFEYARKIISWKPYDQNASADFFDPEWMFGIRDGFDVVIGNPPYLNVELVSRSEKDSYARIYKTFYKRYDVFGLFIEKSLMTLVPKGTVTYIVPSQILNNLSYRKLRELILSNMWLKEVCYLGDKVFKTANNDVCILFLQKPAIRRVRLVNALDFENRTSTQVEPGYFDKFDGVISVSVDESEDALFDKIFNPAFEPIKGEFEVFQGIVTGRNDAYILSKQQIRQARIERELLHPVLLGRDFEKWRIRNIERRILYLNSNTDIKKYPNVAKWLLPHRDRLEQRRECRNGTISWYALQWAREKSRLDYTPKILVQGTRNPRLRTRIVATIDDIGVYGTQGLNFIISKGDSPSVYYLLGILNSSLINYVYLRKFLNVAIKAEYLKNTPIPICSDKEQQRLIALVKRTLAAKRADPGADVSALENEIDQIVYLLYDLTPEEIAIVEAAENV